MPNGLKKFKAFIKYNRSIIVGPGRPYLSGFATLEFYSNGTQRASKYAITRTDYPEAVLIDIEDVT